MIANAKKSHSIWPGAIHVFTLILLLFLNSAITAQTVTPWLTTGDKTSLIAQQGTVNFTTNTGTNPATITLTPSTSYQTMDGFGWCLTQASAQVISGMAATEQNNLLNELFNPSTGLSSSIVRISIAASDLSNSTYSYNETAGDVAMNNFSLAGPDLTYLVPVLKKILIINPTIKILATPWSAPRWMKSNNSWIGGNLQTQYYQAYALYFVKYFQAMAAQGINIWGVTPQNEPENPFNEPSMTMTSTEQKNFINQQLGPQMAAGGYGAVKIIAFDHNCDNTAYPIDVLNNSSYVDGAGFHLYAGNISAMTTVKNATNKNVYFTEQYTGSPGNFSGDFAWHMQNVVIGSVNNWGKAVIEWNLAANTDLGPRTPGGCTSCLPAITVNSATSITRNLSYYIIGQISKFAKVGAVRIGSSSSSSNISTTAFRNTDGSMVVLAYNANAAAVTVKVVNGSNAFSYSIPPASAVTFKWSTGPVVPVTGVTVSPATATVAVNNTIQLTATVAPANATNSSVTWSSGNAAVASVNSNGLVTAVSAGTATITVTTADGNRTATSNITVNVVATTGVSVSPASASIFATQTQQLTATVTPANASNKSVTWASSNTSVATVNANGLVTAVTPGTSTITATTVSGNFTATSAITVKNQEPYTGTPVNLPGLLQAENYDKGGQGIAYNDADASNNGNQYRTAEGVDIDIIGGTSGYTVGWTANGEWLEYTTNITGGTYSIIATVATPSSGRQMVVKLDGTTLATINIPNTGGYGTFQNVTVAGIPFAGGNNKILRFEIVGGDFNIDKVEVVNVVNVPVTGVTVSPTTASISAGATVQLTATVNPANATNQTVSWSSSNTAVATVNATGLVSGVAAGSATITVTTQSGSRTATSTITVTAVATGLPGYYNIISRNSGKGLDVADNSTSSGARLQQYDITNGGGSNQRWSFVSAGGNNYYIKVKSTQMCMAPSGSGSTDGEKVQQRTCGTGNEFKWTVTPIAGGFYKLTNVNSGKSLDVEGVSTSNGANIQVWADNGGGFNQQWQFIQVESVAGRGTNTEVVSPAISMPVSESLMVYPNPADNIVTVMKKGMGIVELIAPDGRVIQKNSFKNRQDLNVALLPKGSYIVRLTIEKKVYLQKIIKQ
ncbi:MAG: Ig-like domain-containing protein [Rhizobacter sp.]|nr:Ig-like domain-containing protein [Ferruginibacter sp.]